MTEWQNELHKSVAAIARIGNSAAKMADSIRAMTKWREDLQKSLAITRIRNPAAQIAESIRAITNWHEDLHKSLAATLVRPPTIDLTNGLPQIAKKFDLDKSAPDQTEQVDRLAYGRDNRFQQDSDPDEGQPLESIDDRIGSLVARFAVLADADAQIFVALGVDPYFIQVWINVLVDPLASDFELADAQDGLIRVLGHISGDDSGDH